MKMYIVKIILQLVMDLLSNIIDKAEEREKEFEKERESFKEDAALAEQARKAYPNLSDQAIMKELC